MPVLIAQNLLTAAANGLPLYGLLYRHVDPFQLLMLYWMETAVAGFWMVLTLARLPEHLLGEITVNGRTRAATNADMVKLFGGLLFAFMAGHFLILWVVFSGDWSHRITGAASFVREFVVKSGAWVPLVLMALAGLVDFCRSPARPDVVEAIQARLSPKRPMRAGAAPSPADGVGPVVGTTLGRIVMMQAGIIFGAMLARSYGSQAPILILIGLKTLFDMRRR
ncbi:DUF6498-containing protein [Bradyrhizobium sp. CCGUVB1N3]|uniref:DUF6498-containing protein n=1 Tax=Bradyrhizobium sp. CCGUVB1N3 TaxID=2949629 RepID=UPI0020B26AAA|nr:DUF6498-containing protein [Bradyrhizobium sp. CCGUVB1N3]MCP3473352.1 DUF6498-containing protein [Bradyrhizobium sp. CCGUVB1N3]